MRPVLRRALHAASPLVILPALWWSWDPVRRLLIVLAAGALVTEIIRLKVPAARAFWQRALPVWRPHEAEQFSGALWLAIAFAIAVHAPPAAALGAILAAAWADPAAAVVGGLVGKQSGKSVAGTVTVLAVTTGVVLGVGYPLAVAVVAGTVAAMLERWAVAPDDNLWVAPGVAVTLLAFA
ncbi:MAG: hypothetical protein WD043_10105 [Gemmatimonadales bacterium]